MSNVENVFVSCEISLESIIGVKSIESMYDDASEHGGHFYNIDENEICEYETIRDYSISSMNLTKNEIYKTNFLNIAQKVCCRVYRDTYTRELYDEYKDHIEEQLKDLDFNYTDANGVCEFYRATHIDILATEKHYNNLCSEYQDDYYTLKEFYDDSINVFEQYIDDNVVQYDIQHFDYYGSRISIDENECISYIDDMDIEELIDIQDARKKHIQKLKNQIKNGYPIMFRTES